MAIVQQPAWLALPRPTIWSNAWTFTQATSDGKDLVLWDATLKRYKFYNHASRTWGASMTMPSAGPGFVTIVPSSFSHVYNGRSLLYCTSNRTFFSVPVTTGIAGGVRNLGADVSVLDSFTHPSPSSTYYQLMSGANTRLMYLSCRPDLTWMIYQTIFGDPMVVGFRIDNGMVGGVTWPETGAYSQLGITGVCNQSQPLTYGQSYASASWRPNSFGNYPLAGGNYSTGYFGERFYQHASEPPELLFNQQTGGNIIFPATKYRQQYSPKFSGGSNPYPLFKAQQVATQIARSQTGVMGNNAWVSPLVTSGRLSSVYYQPYQWMGGFAPGVIVPTPASFQTNTANSWLLMMLGGNVVIMDQKIPVGTQLGFYMLVIAQYAVESRALWNYTRVSNGKL